MRDLKPCPFCGGTRVNCSHLNAGGWEVMCLDCHVALVRPSRDLAVAAWNTRAGASPQAVRDARNEEAEAWIARMAAVEEQRDALRADLARKDAALERIANWPTEFSISPPDVLMRGFARAALKETP